MEIHPNYELKQKAIQLHLFLDEKHSSFIHSKMSDSLEFAFQFYHGLRMRENSQDKEKRLIDQNTAVLQHWYHLTSQKKNRRNEFLFLLIKTFDLQKQMEMKLDIDFYQFVAQNLALLDYKTHEELYILISHSNRIISVTGETLLQQLELVNEKQG